MPKNFKEANGIENPTFDLNNVEIFKVGEWNGETYTIKDLDEIVKAHNEIGDQIKPFVKLGHDEDQKLLQEDGYPSAGWLTNVRQENGVLFTDIKSMPKKIYELVKNKAFGRFSSEIYWNLKMGGKKYPRALKAVALLGANTPAVKTIDDFINLYEDSNNIMYHNENNIECDNLKICKDYADKTKTGGNIMPEEIKKLEERIANLENEKNDIQKKYDDLINEHNEVKGQLEDVKKDYSELNKSSKAEKIDMYLEKQIESGVITPAQKHFYTAIAMNDSEVVSDKPRVYTYKEEDATKTIEYKDSFDLIQKIIANSEKAVNFEEKSKESKHEPKRYDGDNAEDVKRDELIKEYREADKELSYREAFDKANITIAESKNGGNE
jgi:uncharacterized protein (UPF0335 family)